MVFKPAFFRKNKQRKLFDEAWKEIRLLVDCIGDDDPETDRLRRMELLAILDGKEKIK